MTIAALVSGGLGLATQIGAADQARSQQTAAENAQKDAVRAWNQVSSPELKEILMQRYGVSGEMAPTLEQAEQLGMSDQLQNVATDPRLKAAQMSALDTLQKIGQGGFTPEQRAQLQSIRQQTEADNQSRLKALLQQQDARGVGSSDMSLAMRALEAQGAANRQASDINNTAATGFRQALEAMTSAGQLGGQMEQNEYNRQAALAEALRNRELQNFGQRADVQTRNVGAKNLAQQFNLQNQQDVANRNTDIANQQQMYNENQRLQQMFQNQATIAGGKSGVNMGAAQNYANMAQNTAKSGAETGKGIGELGMGIAKLYGKGG